MSFTVWFLIAGGLLLFMALAGSVLKRLPLSTAMVYLAVGLTLGRLGLGLLDLDLMRDAALIERVAEIVVLISLFSAGLKLRMPLSEGRWRLPARLAFGSMTITVGLIALVGVAGLGLPLGAALLLGGLLAPTDPVLAADVQVEHPGDRDRLRFSLTGEAALNDGSAGPFVMLGLGLLGLHELGEFGWRWLAIDVLWAVAGGLAIGWLLGMLVGRLVLYLRRTHKEAVGLDDFLGLGLIALSYGAALLLHSYGFLAVFATGLALRRIEMQSTATQDVAQDAAPLLQPIPGATDHAEQLATDPEHAPAYMAQAVLGFNEQLERIGEVAVVVLVGGLLAASQLSSEALWFVPLLLLVIRPLSVWLGMLGSHSSGAQRWLIAWFGIRGVGSVYYLAYAVQHGLEPALAERITALVLTTVAVSIVVHGISVTPLMRRYRREQPAPQHEHIAEG
ncbi:MAG: cation:proton antiporter [Roseiflexaceae bacterium]